VKVVLDTNVLFSALVFGRLPRELLLAGAADLFELICSPHILDELERKLVQKGGFSPSSAAQSRAEIAASSEVVHPILVPRVVRDMDDDHILAAAVVGRADAIVTGDRDLLDLGDRRGIPIVTPRGFADMLAGED
jgi:putative PIN family toxin of toxin-antitoxin system